MVGPVEISQDGVVEKVVAYIEHTAHPGRIAAFVHVEDHDPLFESGLQVPAGTVEAGESAAAAAVREAHEESGLSGIQLVGHLGEDNVSWPGRSRQRRQFFHL